MWHVFRKKTHACGEKRWSRGIERRIEGRNSYRKRWALMITILVLKRTTHEMKAWNSAWLLNKWNWRKERTCMQWWAGRAFTSEECKSFNWLRIWSQQYYVVNFFQTQRVCFLQESIRKISVKLQDCKSRN